MRLWLIILLLPLFACGDDGNGTRDVDEVACTKIGCTDGFTLRMVAPESGFAAGMYEATVVLDGVTSTCAWVVADSVSGECERTVFTSGEIAITFEQTPDEIAYSVTRGGAVIAADTLTPMYDVVQPNGPDCEPTCRQSVTVVGL